VQVLEALLKAGADVFRKDADDWMALHFAGGGRYQIYGCAQ
jgi:ankyrin repeat protein